MSGRMDSMTPAEYEAGKAKGFQIIDLGKAPSIDKALYVRLEDVNRAMTGWIKKIRCFSYVPEAVVLI